ncbi:MAG: PilZ domain-containing protein [Betaproteobacteria bacterium]
MSEQRRHQRIRFGKSPTIKIGYDGELGGGTVENLSLSGFMVRTAVPLEVGKNFGCEFSVFGSSKIDVAAVTVSRLGDLYGARFQAGPISEVLIKDAIANAVASGQASTVNVHTENGRKIMRIAGGLTGSLYNDFYYSLTKMGIDELDLSAVTYVDEEGIRLCSKAVARYGATIGAQSECFAVAWQNLKRRHGALED